MNLSRSRNRGSSMKKIIVNKCFGGYGLSNVAYEWLHKQYGIPIKKYIPQKRDDNGLYLPEPKNDGEVIFDRSLNDRGITRMDDLWLDHYEKGEDFVINRYWAIKWDEKRDDPRIIKCVEKLGDKANGPCAKLELVEIPDEIEWHIEDYDGMESVHENHRSW